VRDPVHGKVAIKDKGKTVGYEEQILDHGVSDKRLMIVEEEFGNTLRVATRDGNTLSGIIRQAYDGRRLGNLTKNSPFKASDTQISIVGHVTRVELLKYLGNTERSNGFANRFLWACVRRSKVLPEGGGMPNLESLRAALKRAIDLGKNVEEMSRDAECVQLWSKVYPKLSRERPGVLGAVTARAEAHVSRLAMIYALLDNAHVIRAEHLRAALALWNYCYRSCQWVFGTDTGDSNADALLQVMRSRGGMTATEISEFFGRNKSKAQLHQILGPLVAQGLVIPGKPAAGGKPATKWTVTDSANKGTKATKTTKGHGTK
jgi:hypothetical protein